MAEGLGEDPFGRAENMQILGFYGDDARYNRNNNDKNNNVFHERDIEHSHENLAACYDKICLFQVALMHVYPGISV